MLGSLEVPDGLGHPIPLYGGQAADQHPLTTSRSLLVRDAAHLETMATRGGDPAAGGDDPRSLHQTPIDRTRELDDHGAVRTEVADGGDPGA